MRYIQFLITILFLSATLSNTYGQCSSGSFNCNDTIQVSVDEMCEAIISADFILEKPEPTCTYTLQFFDEKDSLLNIPGNTLNVTHVGRTIKVKVLENGVSNPNSCWGYIRVEDKIPAIIECPDFSPFLCLDSDVNDPGRTDEELAVLIRRLILNQDGINDNCTDTASFAVSILKNKLQQLQCSEDYGAQRCVEFELIGIGGRVLLHCEDTIFFSKFNSNVIDDPKDFVGDDALECDGNSKFGPWEKDKDQDKLDKLDIDIYPNFKELFALPKVGPSSFPNIGGRPLIEFDEELQAFVRKGFCNINAAFIDLPPFEICGKSYKLIRRWTIIDWCKNSPPRVVNQIIEVKDTKAPEFKLDSLPDVDASSNTCNMIVDLPVPNVTKECNDWTFCISYKVPGASLFTLETIYQNLKSTDTPKPLVLPIGSTEIRYIIKDVCLNADTVFRQVSINDVNPPLAICDTRTVLNLNNNDKGKIFPPTINDKSFDNCSEKLIFKIWREDGKTALNAPDSSFVKFDGNDIDKDVRVMLEVEDEASLKNRCWTTVEVKRNTSVVRSCPSTVGTLDFCDNFQSYLPEELGLEAKVLEREETGCGEGYLVVQWIDTTFNSNSILCQGDTIFFERLNSVNTSDFALPLDIEVSECDNIEPTAQDLANILNNSAACNFMSVVFQDVVFTEKIFRNFSIIDLCTGVALMHHTQIIEIIPSNISQIDLATIFEVPNPGITKPMSSDGNLEIEADFFNIAPGDECYTNLDVRVRKRGEAVYKSSVNFTCNDIAKNVVFDIDAALFDTDGSLFSEKATKLLIDDNSVWACPSGSVNIVGAIRTEQNNAVENVNVELMTIEKQSVSSTSSNISGQYAFNQMVLNQYTIVSSKNDDMLNGVSTLDLVLIQQHILGIKTFESPYKVIAADINNNQSITAADLLELRKVILGVSSAFSNNSSWRFVDANHTFDDILNPWGFKESQDVSGEGEFDFVGVKVGDVNANVIANSLMTSTRNRESINLFISNESLQKGQRSIFTISGDKSGIALQLKLHINKGVKITKVLNEDLEVLNSSEYILSDNDLTISHILENQNETLFAIEVEAIKNIKNIKNYIKIADDFNNEWYSSSYEAQAIESFSILEKTVAVNSYPNPFNEETTLNILSNKEEKAIITIFNIGGQKIFEKSNITLEKGTNQFRVKPSDLLNTPGIYMYQVQVEGQNLKGKMIYMN